MRGFNTSNEGNFLKSGIIPLNRLFFNGTRPKIRHGNVLFPKTFPVPDPFPENAPRAAALRLFPLSAFEIC